MLACRADLESAVEVDELVELGGVAALFAGFAGERVVGVVGEVDDGSPDGNPEFLFCGCFVVSVVASDGVAEGFHELVLVASECW